LDELRANRERSGKEHLPFFEVPSMRMGVYALAAGADDTQSPHEEDEVYYAVRGRAVLQVDSKDYPVEAGSLVFVAAHAVHKFHSIQEPLETLVIFLGSSRASLSAPEPRVFPSQALGASLLPLTRRRRTRHGACNLAKNHADVFRNIRHKHAGNYRDEPADHGVLDKILTVLVAPNPEADQQTPHLLHSGVCSLSLFY
jgi:mannose-6-phosphate isomerase-like protein (cupin superfamily)